jgi:hypothetical protein
MGLGIFVALIGRTAPININSGILFDLILAIERVKIGVISGIVTGFLLLLITVQSGRGVNP